MSRPTKPLGCLCQCIALVLFLMAARPLNSGDYPEAAIYGAAGLLLLAYGGLTGRK